MHINRLREFGRNKYASKFLEHDLQKVRIPATPMSSRVTKPRLRSVIANALRRVLVQSSQNERSKLSWTGSSAVEVESGLTTHQTHYRSYRGQVFTDQMTQPTVSKALKEEE